MVRESFDPQVFLSQAGDGKRIMEYRNKQVIFSQGAVANVVCYVLRGKVKLTVMCQKGKEAVLRVLGPGEFFGEGCLGGQAKRVSAVVAMGECCVLEIERNTMADTLHREPAMAELFLNYLLGRNIQMQEDLVDQLFNSSEKRLARVLILLSRFGQGDNAETVMPKITHETLAEMVGTTRARITFFMNKFRKLGLIEYNGELRIRCSLLRAVLRD